MTFCTRECPPDCLKEKLEMARRIEELEKLEKQAPVGWIFTNDHLAHTDYCFRAGEKRPDERQSWKPVFAHPNQSIADTGLSLPIGEQS